MCTSAETNSIASVNLLSGNYLVTCDLDDEVDPTEWQLSIVDDDGYWITLEMLVVREHNQIKAAHFRQPTWWYHMHLRNAVVRVVRGIT